MSELYGINFVFKIVILKQPFLCGSQQICCADPEGDVVVGADAVLAAVASTQHNIQMAFSSSHFQYTHTCINTPQKKSHFTNGKEHVRTGFT